MKRTIIIGDIHGCFYTLRKLLKKISYNWEKDKIIFVGDYIDRGKHSPEVVDFLIKLQEKAGENCICIMGNHEYMAACDPVMWFYESNGGQQTILQYEGKKDIFQSHIAWFKTLPYYQEEEWCYVCHAGFSYPKFEQNTVEDILWGREWIRNKKEPNEKPVIFGHTPFTNKHYITKDGSIGIDCGCVYGGNLCAMVIDETISFTYQKKDKKD